MNWKKHLKTLGLASVALSAMAFLTACGNDSATVDADVVEGNDVPMLTIYSNSVADGRGEWLVKQAAQAGFNVQYVSGGGGEIQDRLIAEQNSPIADVTFGLNAFIFETLIAEDILIPYTPVWADEVMDGLNHPEGYFHAIVQQAILLAYDKNQVDSADAPTDWLDLWQDEAFHGAYEFQTSLGGGTTRMVLSGILYRFRDEDGELGISPEGWEAIAAYYQYGVRSEEEVDLYAQIANPDSPVLFGQIWSGGMVAREEEHGVNTGFPVPSVGVPFAVEGVAIVNGTNHLEEAQRFVDWFGSAKTQGAMAEAFSLLPANELALDSANDFNRAIAELPLQEIDWYFVASNIDAWMERIELQYMR